MKPWLQRKQWRENKIASNAKVGMYVIWGFTILWNAISLPIFFTSPSLIKDIQEKPETALVFLFPMIGIVLVGVSIRAVNNWRKFGSTPLVLDPFPGSISGQVGGTILTRISYEPNLNFIVTLSCLYSYISGSGKNRSRRERVKWQTEGVCFSTPHREGSSISFRFDTPPDLPESETKDSTSYHLWRVAISCDLPGTDFERSYEIPVYKGSRHSSIKHGTEAYHKTMDQALDGLDEIAQITTVTGGLEFYYPAFKRPAGGIMATIFGLIFATAGVIMWRFQDIPIIFPITFTPIGLLILSIGIWELGKSLRVRVTRDQIFSRRFFLAYPITSRSFSAKEIQQLRIKEGSSVSNGKKTTVFYSIIAHTTGSKKLVVAERLASKPEALLIKENLEQYLPSTVKESLD
jgi:hypothetical protein